MPRPVPRTTIRTLLRRTLVAATTGAVAATTVAALVVEGPAGSADAAGTPATASARRAANVVTPGDFVGYGFDQCQTQSQSTMDRWLESSPFLAVGIYISGDSRGCRTQPNLTPTWVSNQLARGWRLLPITLGPQASCSPYFPRYGDDETIRPRPGRGDRYRAARRQAAREAEKTADAAQRLGIAPGSTLWYDLEGFDVTNTRCRESALAFLSRWTTRIHGLGYVSGVYSSAGSGIKMLDDARVNRPGRFALPDQIWIARWDGVANTSTSYVREDGWQPHARVKQYRGGHNETWGGATINIDRDFLDVGRGMVAAPEKHCGGVPISYRKYQVLRPPTADSAPSVRQVEALQCLLTEQGLYRRAINGTWTRATRRAIHAWQAARGFAQRDLWARREWVSLLSAGDVPVVKFGSTGPAVRRLQRALNAAGPVTPLRMNGLFTQPVTDAVRDWQKRAGVPMTGVAGTRTWQALNRGES